MAGGAIDNGIQGEDYGLTEIGFDSFSGAVLTRVPSATDTDPNPTWQHHAVDGIVSAETGAIVRCYERRYGGLFRGNRSETVVSDSTAPDDSKGLPPGRLTEQDLVLGKKAAKYSAVLCSVALAVTLGIALYVFLSVPLDTRLPYQGQYGRNGIPMPFALLPVLLVLLGLLRGSIKPDAHHMGKGSRGGLYILGTAMVIACVFFQFVFARAILIEGGALAG